MKKLLCAIALAALGAPLPALAQDQHDMCALEVHCRTATAAELDALRGGFDLDTDGRGRLRVDIGITRSVSINDKLVGVSHLVVPDLGALMGDSRRGGQGTPPAPNPQLSTITLPVTGGARVLNDGTALIIQSGPNNTAPTPGQIGTLAMPTIVQNTLDNQKISTLTLVNARVNSMSLMNSLRVSDMMNRATAASGR